MKNGLTLKYITKTLIIIFIITLITYITIKTGNYINQKKFNNYIKDYGYKVQNYNIYTLNKKIDNNETTYQVLYDTYYFSKNVIINNNENITKINYYYNKNKEIIIEYESSNVENGNFSMTAKKATYKNNKLKKCEIILGNDKNCNNLNNISNEYKNEINEILNNYKINLFFIKINKKAS